MEPLAPAVALSGGLLIGGAAAVLLLLKGRIAGVSGLAARAAGITRGGPPWADAAAFILGLPAGAWLVAAFVRAPQIEISRSAALLVAGGLLVGFGTQLGHGCTSGHGVCGVARLSPRSLAATAVFMACGMATVFVTRHAAGG
jgi:uncharacterized membrane protein YedE/YeeE